ncbi:MAG TPA: histidine kinase [Puia sp.]|nr:histidine kinase [Puia sp.]
MKVKNVWESKYVFHLLLWLFFLLSLGLDTTTLGSTMGPWTIFLYVILKTAAQAALVYLNILVLYPVFFKRKKYLLFFGSLVATTAIVGYVNTTLEFFVDSGALVWPFPGKWNVYVSQSGMAARYALISFLLKISVDYYEQKERLKKIELEKTIAELNFLKAQVNPHFLLNTLNNLYALILEKSEKSGEAVLKLADIMKYILAEGKEDKVKLSKEIDLLHNYAELERLRKPNAEIEFRLEGIHGNDQITPLLLLPLVENAFKYGLNSVARNGFVRINIAAENNKLNLTVENNMPPKDSPALQSLGIGIKNLNKRLEILYPGKYMFTRENVQNSYLVKLQLQLT